ncbi:SCAN domain-containing protein 1-like [Canis lupus dingo]|uniref:SCAN domain-containing protein 1-like n=1 Tax=Canis lupus dingo TaxID=286419 RepID=UPI0020C5197F|nr:SCAN domain-containing protein 1-like [Canis lupus dingo]
MGPPKAAQNRVEGREPHSPKPHRPRPLRAVSGSPGHGGRAPAFQGLAPASPPRARAPWSQGLLTVTARELLHLPPGAAPSPAQPSPAGGRSLVASYLPLWIVPLGPRPSGGSWSFASGRWLRPEMRTLERVLGPLVSVQLLALLAQEIHSRVQKLLLQSCEEAVPVLGQKE